jgi:hypothetical protein
MKDRTKSIINTFLFVALLIGILIANMIKKPAEISVSERRKLAQFPKASMSSILNGDFTSEFSKYVRDQFILRDEFRSVKAFVHFNVYRQKDNNNIYIADGSVIKIDYPLNEKSVENAAKKFNSLYEIYFEGMNVWYSIIPDKNYYTAEKYGYPHIDYNKMIEILTNNVNNMSYIDITSSLCLDDYYRSDLHWKQEKLGSVIDTLSREMNFQSRISLDKYTKNIKEPFYGVYYGQSALNIRPDRMIYLTNEAMKDITVFYFDTQEYGEIYQEEKFSGIDPYNLFLSGPAAVIIMENKNAKTDKELVLFRDSFGSSLAPLLAEEYAKITLIDLRYIDTNYLGKVVEFTNQDILFMLNTQIINNSYMLR